MRKTLSVLTLSCAVAMACSEGPSEPGPAPNTGVFVLRTVAGEALPSRLWDSPMSLTFIADTIRFDPSVLALFSDPTLERRTVWRDAQGAILTPTRLLQYDIDRSTMTFNNACPPTASCILPELVSGRFSGDRLEVTAGGFYRSPLVYQRIP